MSNEVKGFCLFMGLIGLGYAFLLVLFTFISGVKIIKSIVFISVFSIYLIQTGLTSQVKTRLFNYLGNFVKSTTHNLRY
jgi:UPF0716 family protein affecting phage T7 exclusion